MSVVEYKWVWEKVWIQTAFVPHVNEKPRTRLSLDPLHAHTVWTPVCVLVSASFSLRAAVCSISYQITPWVRRCRYLGEWRQYVSLFDAFAWLYLATLSVCGMRSCRACVMTLADWWRQIHPFRTSQWANSILADEKYFVPVLDALILCFPLSSPPSFDVKRQTELHL